jgi:hypothetical protein
VSSTDDGGFLSRWARRKAAARSGVVAPEPVAPQPPPPPAAVTPAPTEACMAPPATALDTSEPAAATPPPPTMDDVARLTPDADFGRFVARDVDPGVRNAAMKKLFSDPHYNVMDGLDIYIDDYGKPDPIPKSMLRGLAQSHLLGLFKDEADDKPDSPRDAKPDQAAATATLSAEPDRTHDEDPDLQLQPDDAAGAPAGEPGGAHPGGDAAGER